MNRQSFALGVLLATVVYQTGVRVLKTRQIRHLEVMNDHFANLLERAEVDLSPEDKRNIRHR